MNCPVDGTVLTMADRQGIEIDYCPKCRGIWLDRGELDKIIERSASSPDTDDRDDRYDDDRPRYEGRYEKPHGKRRRKSLLEDLFDFG